MTRFARIAAGRVAEIIIPPTGWSIEDMFHPDLLATFHELRGADTEAVEAGWLYEDGSFAPPPAEPPPPPARSPEAIMAEIQAKQAEIAALLDQLPSPGGRAS